MADELEAGPPPLRVFVDVRELQPGQDWDRQLVEAIRTCAAVLFVMTDDSVRDESGCKAEWVAALSSKKPVIPLRLSAGAALPFRLGSRQFIDFSDRFESGVAQLRKHLSWRASPAGVLQDLRERCADAEYELPRADRTQRERIEREIEELRGRIQKQQQVVANPRLVAEQTDARIGAAIERERQPERPETVPAQAKFVNPPPVTAPAYFQDRHVETGLLGDFLRADGLRMMSVVGRGGVGKTAMVCRLLKALETGRLPDELGELAVDGIVYLSPLGLHPVDFAHLFPDLCRLLPNDVAEPLLERFHDPHETPAALMRLLLERFPAGRWVLLLDNFEDVVDAAGAGLTDSALEEALLTLLRAPQHGVKVIVTTRVAARDVLLVQPGVQRRLNLDEGLPSPFAEDVLRAMDPDGSLGIRDAPGALLAQARERTRGFPRALEALAAILAADRDTTFPELIDATESLPENVVEALVGEAFSRLDVLAQQVVQALAVYPWPVPPVAVDYLLQPFEPAIDSAPVLARLVNMQFVRRDAGRYHLHQVDRDFALQRVAAGEPSDRHADPPPFSRYGLRERAATYFQETRTPRETWKTLDDLAPQLAEFELRCEAGDHDTAARVLVDISSEYLQVWGHVRLARDLHERVREHLSDPWVNAANLSGLGFAYETLGELRRATELFEQAVAIDRELGDRGAEAGDLTSLGQVYRVLGDMRRSTELHEQALAIFRELGNPTGEANALTSLGIAYRRFGEVRRAIELHEQALALYREIGSRRGEAAALISLGIAYGRLGEMRRAIDLYEQALAIHRDFGDRSEEGVALGNLGEAYAALGEVPRAIELLEQALTIFREIGRRDAEALALCSLGEAHLDAGDGSRSINCSEQGVRIADEIGLAEASGEGRVVLARAHVYAGEPHRARAAAHAALTYAVPTANAKAGLVLGIALTQQGRVDAARAAFRDTVKAADDRLAHTVDSYDELDSRALALCGLAILDDPAHAGDAIEAFRSARATTRADGIVARVLRLFDALAISDEAGILAAVRPAAAGEA